VSLFKAASTVSLLTLASRVTGLVRDLLMASMFGASALTDAFNVAFRIPNLFRRLFAEGAFAQAFVPVLATTKTKEGEEATHRLIAAVATALAWTLLLTCALGVLGAPRWCGPWPAACAKPRGFDAAVLMTRWMFPYIGFMSMVALAAGILNTWKHFAVPAASPVLLNLCMIGAAWLGAPSWRRAASSPFTPWRAGDAGGVLQLGVQIPVLLRMGLMPRIGVTWGALRAAWAEPGVRRVLTLMAPILLGVGVAQVSLMINTQIASYLAPGSVTWLFYADRLMEFPTALLGWPWAWCSPAAHCRQSGGDAQKYSAMLDWGLRIVVLLAVPCAVALLTFAKPLVATLFHYGKLADTDVGQIAVALAGYGAGLLGLVAIKVLAPGYYASQDMRTPVKIAIVVLVITQILNAVWCRSSTTRGWPCRSAWGLVNALWLLIGLVRRGYQPQPGWSRFALQVVAASALLAVLLPGARITLTGGLRAHSGQRVLLLGLMAGRRVFRCPVGRRAQAAADAAPLSVLCTRRSGGNTG
jgi:putative peptidoglycan lipid II flippase